MRTPNQNSPETLAAAFEWLQAQSGQKLHLFECPLQCKVFGVWRLKDTDTRGGCMMDIWDGEGDSEHKNTVKARSLIRIVNPTDQWCLARDVAIGIAKDVLGGATARFRRFVDDEGGVQGESAIQLMEGASVDTTALTYDARDANRLQHHLESVAPGRYRITIFSKEQFFRIVFKGGSGPVPCEIPLFLERGHYSYIGEPRELFKARGYCIDCETRAYPRIYHFRGCVYACRLCYRYGPERPCRKLPGEPRILCDSCDFVFENGECYAYHLRTQQTVENRARDGRAQKTFRSICSTRFRCEFCQKIVYARKSQPHECTGLQVQQRPVVCANCYVIHTASLPYCFIQPITGEKGKRGGKGDGRPWIKAGTKDPPPYSKLTPRSGSPYEDKCVGDEEEVDSDNKNDVHELSCADSNVRYVFYDIESTQETPIPGMGTGLDVAFKHEAILLVAEVLCTPCMNEGVAIAGGAQSSKCCCGVFGSRFRFTANLIDPGNRRLLAFSAFDDPNVNPIDRFLHFLFDSGPQGIKTICVAHNGGRYDFHLTLERMYERGVLPKMTTTGLKIYSMSVKGQHRRCVIFKDTLNFFSCSLADLFKTFELSDAAQHKPFFPYLFCTRKNLESPPRLTLPPQSDYGVERMKPVEKEQFFSWYEKNKNTFFNLRDQLLTYCRNDVAIMRAAVVKFRQLLSPITCKIEPFLNSSTIAKLALDIYRAEFLDWNRLLNAPEGGFNKRGRQSIAALRFFRLLERLTGWKIKTAEWSVGEGRVDDCGYRIDGLVTRPAPLRPVAWEFNGCFYHGCNKCYKNRSLILSGDRTAEELYEATQKRAFDLERRGYKVRMVWECEFTRALKRLPRLKELYEQITVTGPLNPRSEGLRGGRTEPFALYFKCAPDEEIIYTDIVSLYPYVMKYGEFPTGTPELFTREKLTPSSGPNVLPWTSASQNTYKGLIKCRVLAPRALDPPLLPYRTKVGRLVFPLCASCAELQTSRPCSHTPLQRSWIAAFTHAELNKGLELGYSVLDLFEVWHYPEKQWASLVKGNGLFDGYINAFLKLKVENSGWPKDAQTLAERAEYISRYEHVEGIRLDPEKMVYNGGLRHIAKLMLNSLWGKFCQRSNPTMVMFTKTGREFHDLLEEGEYEMLDAVHLTEDLDRVVLRRLDPLQRAPKTNCLPVAIFVTSLARLHLYRFMREAVANKCQLLYCDTDSLMAVRKRGAAGITEGFLLGEMMREFIDRIIYEFVACGPKNITFRHRARNGGGDVYDVEEVVRIRGFELTAKAREQLCLDTMRQMVWEKFGDDFWAKAGLDTTIPSDNETHSDSEDSNDSDQLCPKIEYLQIRRDKYARVYTQRIVKRYRVVYTKGWVDIRLRTRPFGYQRVENA